MIEDIVNGIWEDVWGDVISSVRYNFPESYEQDVKRRWRLIIRKAILESSCSQMELDCSQVMLEETAVMDR